MIPIRLQRLRPEARSPHYGHLGDAGMDVFSCEEYVLQPGERRRFPLGFALEFPSTYVALIWDKSGLAFEHGIHTIGGVIDSSYRGEFHVILINSGNRPYEIRVGDKIAQLLIQPIETATIEVVDSLSNTGRGDQGFGSTGR